MIGAAKSDSRWVRYLHEFLFSLNLSLALKLAAAQRPFWATGFLPSDVTEARIAARINALLHLHPHSRASGVMAFVFIAMVIALCMFALLRVTSRLSLVSQFLFYVPGIVSLIAFPTVFFYQRHYFGVERGMPNLHWYWLALELALAVVCCELFLWGMWPTPRLASGALAAVHFGFWAWLYFGGIRFDLAPSDSIFPIVGILSLIAWAAYVTRERSERAAYP
jgi:hypothetical protein